MARMIPFIISEEEAEKSPAEARVFGWLKKMTWGDAIVLHSLPLKDHIKKSFGEIDFVIICDKGILCVEVKGGGVIRQDGIWGFIGKHGITWKNEGPYIQVQGNMKSLRKYLSDHIKNDDEINGCRWACCVMTPDCVIRADEDTEIIPEITFNSSMKESDIPSMFERSFRYWGLQKHFGGSDGLSKQAREKIASFLRSDFNFVPSLSTMLSRVDEQLASTTIEQYEIIQGALANDRMMVEGGAGTGKTMLATEQCRRSSITGEKVLYLCFNSMIAQFVRETFSSELNSSGIDVYTFHELLLKACGLSSEAVTDKETFFNATLPNMFLERSPESYRQYQYDRVVIDEGQDLMNMTAYFCLNEIIIGGWDDGKWTIYYDPNQNLFGTENDFKETWSALSKNAFRYSLSVNCRNTRQIAQGNYAITHVYKAKVMRTDGEKIEYVPYKSKQSEAEMVFDEIRRLRSEGLSKKDIVILSYYRMDNPNCCLYGMDVPSDIGNIRQNATSDFGSSRSIRYYTIKSFKGLEAKAVIMIDVDSFSEEDKRLQNYVGMSRARTYLAFFYDERLNKEREKRLLEALMN